MTASDLLRISLRNLWRTRLRSSLTVLGVIIGIGALISMVSFGSGMEKNVTDAFSSSDLFSKITVTPMRIDMDRPMDALADTSANQQPLDDTLLTQIRNMEGVKSAFGEIQQPAKVGLGDQETTVNFTGIDMGLRSEYEALAAGTFFTSDTMPEAIVTSSLLRRLHIRLIDKDDKDAPKKDTSGKWTYVHAEDLIGDTLLLSTATLNPMNLMGALMGIGEQQSPIAERKTVLKIVGVQAFKSSVEPMRTGGDLLLPQGFALTIPAIGFNSITDFLRNGDGGKDKYGSIQVLVKRPAELSAVKQALEKKGLHVFALADELKEVRRAFIAVNAVLGVIGFIALLVAGLGIINTLLMSILERTREIGIMKAIGGSEGQIKRIFFGEAAVIGLAGALGGILLGWLVTIAAGAIINMKVKAMGEAPVDLFYFPWWLILGSIAFAVGISLLAGLYPASRAARIDPVEALRWS